MEQFAKAVAYRNREDLANLLAEDGEFCARRNDMEFEEYKKTHPDEEEASYAVNKEDFLVFIDKCWGQMEGKEISFSFDQCLSCMIGNPIVLFNGGHFPVRYRLFYESDRTGMMLEIEDQKINGLTFCYRFLKNENPMVDEALRAEGKWWPDYDKEYKERGGLW